MTQITLITASDGTLLVDSRLIAQEMEVDGSPNDNPLVASILDKDFLDVYDVLAIVRCASGKSATVKLLEIAERLSNNSLTSSILRMAVIEGLALDISSARSERSSVQSWFENNFKDYFPDAKLVKVYALKRKRPDCILDINGVHYPVECKLNFSRRGLAQLEQYMDLWKVNFGIAVAHQFSAEIPECISTVKVSK